MSIATCPKCHRQVSLPTTDDHSIWVRCPLCGGQYPLRTALEHVPPSLEIVGPDAEQTTGDVGLAAAGFGARADLPTYQDMQAGGGPIGETPAQDAPQGDVSAHGEMHPPADTLAHPEQGAIVMPLEADHSQHAPEQPIETHDDISEHLIDFELEGQPGQSEVGMIGHAEAAPSAPPCMKHLPPNRNMGI